MKWHLLTVFEDIGAFAFPSKRTPLTANPSIRQKSTVHELQSLKTRPEPLAAGCPCISRSRTVEKWQSSNTSASPAPSFLITVFQPLPLMFVWLALRSLSVSLISYTPGFSRMVKPPGAAALQAAASSFAVATSISSPARTDPVPASANAAIIASLTPMTFSCMPARHNGVRQAAAKSLSRLSRPARVSPGRQENAPAARMILTMKARWHSLYLPTGILA